MSYMYIYMYNISFIIYHPDVEMVDIPANHLGSKQLVCPEMCDLHQCPRKSSNVHVFSSLIPCDVLPVKQHLL